MSSIFSEYKDSLLDYIDDSEKSNLRFPLRKTGNIMNNYTRGDFIVVGGRKTSGKSSYILNNYVISPLVQKLTAKKNNKPFDVKIIYINTRRNLKTTMERMIVNYISQKNKGHKVGVPSLYGLDGNHKALTKVKSKSLMSGAMNALHTFSEKGILSTIASRKSLYEIDNIIRASMSEYGEYDEENNEFTYDEEHKDLTTIVSIDDITGIFSETGSNNIKNDNAHQLATKLKALAKVYNILIVLAVPSSEVYIKATGHRSSLGEIAPYHIYADRSIIFHNPYETEDMQMLGYETRDFINQRTGVCYLRTAFIASNYMGPSGVHVGYFLYPENGYFIELPKAEDSDEIEVFSDRARE